MEVISIYDGYFLIFIVLLSMSLGVALGATFRFYKVVRER